MHPSQSDEQPAEILFLTFGSFDVFNFGGFSLGSRDEEYEKPVEQANDGENDERNFFAAELVQGAAERRRHQTAERNARQRDTQRLRTGALLVVSAGWIGWREGEK